MRDISSASYFLLVMPFMDGRLQFLLASDVWLFISNCIIPLHLFSPKDCTYVCLHFYAGALSLSSNIPMLFCPRVVAIRIAWHGNPYLTPFNE